MRLQYKQASVDRRQCLWRSVRSRHTGCDESAMITRSPMRDNPMHEDRELRVLAYANNGRRWDHVPLLPQATVG